MSRAAILAALTALLLGASAKGQTGMSISYAGGSTRGSAATTSRLILALRYDHDITSHLAFGVDFGFQPVTLRTATRENLGEAIQYGFDYRAYYLTGDNEATSFFVGSHLGVYRGSLEGYRNTSYTAGYVGLRAGIRGGLEGSFGDLFVEGGAQLGGSVKSYEGKTYALSGLTFMVGFSYGFGWE